MAPDRTSGFLLRILGDRRLLWPGYVVVMCVLSAVYFGSLRDHLLAAHDQDMFLDNIAIERDPSHFFALEKRHLSGRPSAELVKYAAYRIGGNSPAFFHLFVVALHAAAAVVLARVAWQFGMNSRSSLVGGLLFLVNVSHFQAVHHISALDYPLALVCGLIAMLFYERHLRTPRWGWWAGIHATLITGVMAHLAMVVTLPFIAYWTWIKQHNLSAASRALLPLGIVTALALAFLFSIPSSNTSTWKSVGMHTGEDPLGFLSNVLRLLLLLLGRLITTAHWILTPLHHWQPWEPYAGALVFAGLSALVCLNRSPCSVWALWSLLSVVPFCLIYESVVLEQAWDGSRYLYFASGGVSLLLAWSLEEMSQRLRAWGPPLYLGILALILCSSYFYLKQTEAIALYGSGRSYIAGGDSATGVQQLKRAIDRGRDVINLEDAYGRICFVGMGKPKEEAVLDEALAAFPKNQNLHMYKLALESMKPDSLLSTRAREQLELLKRPDPPVSIATRSGQWIILRDKEAVQGARRNVAAFYHNAGFNLGTGRVTRDDLDRAILAYRRSLEFDPDRTGTSKNLAIDLASAGRQSEAVTVALEAVERNPGAPAKLQVVASLALLGSGRAEEAIALCQRALEDPSVTEFQSETVFGIYGDLLDGDYGEVSSAAATRMGMDLLAGGRAGEAVRAFRQALEKDAANPRAHFGLGVALLSQGQVEEAEKHYAEGVARFGRTAAAEAGAVEGIRSLIARGIQVEAARKLLATHWPER